MLGGRASSRTTCGWCSFNSAASSTVTTRSPSGMKEESTFNSVVLPAPEPPETKMFSLIFTHAARNAAMPWVIVPKPMRSSTV